MQSEMATLKLKSENLKLPKVLQKLQKGVHIAARKGDVKFLQHLLNLGADAKCRDIHGRTPLHYAVHNGHVEAVKILLKSGADVTQATNNGNTALHTATSKGHNQLVEILLQHVCREKLIDFVNAKTASGGNTALHVAAKCGHLEIIKSLLEHGASYSTKNKEGKTPFDLSEETEIIHLLRLTERLFSDIENGNAEALSILGGMQPDEFSSVINARNRKSNTLLQVAVINRHKDIADKLLNMVKQGCQAGSLETIESEFEKLEKLNGITEEYFHFPRLSLSHLYSFPCNTLHQGSHYLKNAYRFVEAYKRIVPGSIDDKYIKSVNYTLVSLEFDPKHVTSVYGYYLTTGNSCVCEGNGTKYFKLLHGGLVEDIREFTLIIENNIETPVKRFAESIKQRLQVILPGLLLDAIEKDDLEQVEKYIKIILDVSLKYADGGTPLHHAVNRGNINIVRTFIRNGVHIVHTNNEGKTALHIASSRGYADIAEVLLHYVSTDKLNAFVNDKMSCSGNTSLHIAAENGNLGVLKCLLKYGATYDIKNNAGKTPADISKNQKVTNLLKLIEELFRAVQTGHVVDITKLRGISPNELPSVKNARNNTGNTLLQIAAVNNHKDIAENLLNLLKQPDPLKTEGGCDFELDQLELLKNIANVHTFFSQLYLSRLKHLSESPVSEKNLSPSDSFREGFYYLRNAYGLVKVYKECLHCSINTINIRAIYDTLLSLEFDPEHITSEYSHTGNISHTVCFNSKYYELLHSDSKNDVRSFIEMAELNIEIPVKRFLETIEQRLQTVLSENLLEAIENQDLSAVDNCIERGVQVNFKDSKGETPLHNAVNCESVDIVSCLLTNGAQPTQLSDAGKTTLHVASSKDNRDLVELLLEHIRRDKLNNFVDAKILSSGDTALHVAATNGCLEVVKCLLRHGATYNKKNREGKTPVDVCKHQEVSKFLNLVDEIFRDIQNANTAAIAKLKKLKPEEFLAVMSTHKTQTNTLVKLAPPNNQENVAAKLAQMLEAFEMDRLKILKSSAENHLKFSEIYLPMLQNMSHPRGSEENPWPWKTLKEGSYYLGNAYYFVSRYKKCIPGWIDDINVQSVNDTLVALEFHPKYRSVGYTDEAYSFNAVCFVSKGQGKRYYDLLHSEKKEDVRSFIKMAERNIDIPVKRFIKSVESRLQLSVPERFSSEVQNDAKSETENCIKPELELKCKDTSGENVLHLAVNKGNVETVTTLLKKGADVTQTTKNGATALHIASSKGHTEIVYILLRHVRSDEITCFINARTNGGNTALHVSAKNGHFETVKCLLKHGAEYDIRNGEWKTPLEISKTKEVENLLKVTEELFREIENGNLEAINKLQSVKGDELLAITNACNNRGNTIFEIIESYRNSCFAGKLFQAQEEEISLASKPNVDFELDHLLQLKNAAELHLRHSNKHLSVLRNMMCSHSGRLEDSASREMNLKEGSYYLWSAYQLVETYKGAVPGSIDNKNMWSVNNMLVELEFDPKHLPRKKLCEPDSGVAKHFVSKGQGTKYYELLNSKFNKDINSFVEMVENNIESNVKSFHASIKWRLLSTFSRILNQAIQNESMELELHAANNHNNIAVKFLKFLKEPGEAHSNCHSCHNIRNFIMFLVIVTMFLMSYFLERVFKSFIL